MMAQLWIQHRLKETSWPDFIAAHRADVGEAAFHRVGSFYDRVGTLVRLGLVQRDEIVPTIGAYAIVVWQKIEPLVREARRIEHSTLFQDFEKIVPWCYECYVPALGPAGQVQPFSLLQSSQDSAPAVVRISPAQLHERLQNGTVTVVDARPPAQVASDPRGLPGAIPIPVAEVETRHKQLPANREVVVYCA
jgi:hypothetical protein